MNRISFHPSTVGELVEVRAGLTRATQVVQIDAAHQGLGGRPNVAAVDSEEEDEGGEGRQPQSR